MSREGLDPIDDLTIEIYMLREGLDTINGLTMDIYMSRECWNRVNRFNHGYLYVKRGFGSHQPVQQLRFICQQKIVIPLTGLSPLM